jgi:type VI secretion system secreted protein Hcp
MPIYMKYASIDGDVTESSHSQWIEVNSFQWGVGRGISSPTGGSSDREASAPSVTEAVVTKPTDAATIKLIDEALEGEGQDCTIDFCKTDNGQLSVYLSYMLNNTMISGYTKNSSGDRPMENLSLNFTKIAVKDVALSAKNSDGTPSTVTYDVGLGKIV